MKHLLIMNTHSSSDDKEALKNEILKSFEGLDYELYETKGPKDATKFLKEYFKKNKEETRVYACGGDGTLHEVANGLVGAENAELALIPTGTGNDFAKYYGGLDAFKDVKKSINGKAEPIDIIEIRGASLEEPLYSINVVNFGFDAIVGARGNYYKDNGYPEKYVKKGMSPYDYALKFDAMKHGRFNEIEVFADGEKLNEKKMLLCTLANGRYVGGKFLCAPKSINNDGLIDVCVLKTMTLIGLGMLIGKYTAGKHLNKKKRKIVYRRAKEIRIVAPAQIDLCVDGEMIVGQEFDVKVLPGAIKFVVPEE